MHSLQELPDGFGGRHDGRAHEDAGPYGPRALGATADDEPRPAAATAPAAGAFAWSVQRLIDDALAQHGAVDVQGAAAHGTSGATTELPHREAIQRAFGRHDVSGVQAHVGGAAREGAAAMGAEAFAAGNHVAFAAAPSLHTAAHEAAHVVQQRAGVQLLGGVGAVGDVYERHADAVADRVLAGESAEDLLDQHAGGGATGVGAVQRQQFVTTPGALQNVLLAPVDPAGAAIGVVGQNITAYNVLDQNNGLQPHVKIQQQIDLLRVLDRSAYAALSAISANQVDLRHDARAQRLHTVLQESEVEHRRLVDQVVGDQQLRQQVDCFDAQHTDNQNNDIGQQQARALWNRIMDGGGKVQILGRPEYQSKVRSWLTKLMDTRQGRRMLQYLDTGNQGDLGTNVYLGELISDLPQGIQLVNNLSGDLENKREAVAQPLLTHNTSPTPRAQPQNDVPQVNTGAGFNEAVLTGAQGVSVGGQEYDFSQHSSGSFVAMINPGQMRVATGVDRQNGLQTETPEVYQPDWLLLGHELGHSLNMRAGATTDGRVQHQTPNDVFARTMTGDNDLQSRQGRWYGGSEEYINITGHENTLRQQGGLDERGAHTGAVVFERRRRRPQFDQALNPGAWFGMYQGGACLPEANRVAQYNQDRIALEGRWEENPSDPAHLLAAAQLSQDLVNYFTPRVQARQQAQNQVNNVLAGGAARNALDANRPYEATLQAQYDVVVTAINAELRDDPASHHILTKALRIVTFCQEWLAMRQAHDAAGNWKQLKWKAWWEKAKSANHSVGTAIAGGDNDKYARKRDRVRSLHGHYA